MFLVGGSTLDAVHPRVTNDTIRHIHSVTPHTYHTHSLEDNHITLSGHHVDDDDDDDE